MRVPSYYKKFHCIAGKCKDNCCSAGWEIDIDDKTNKYYKSVSDKFDDEFGNKLRNCISDDSSLPHFILKKDKKCPFLNDDNLCDIYINLGEDHLCQICTDHPRFYEWFENVKEAGIGLCCEEAARIILDDNDKFEICDFGVDDVVDVDDNNTFDNTDINSSYISGSDYKSDLYDYLQSARMKIISYIENSPLPISVKIRNILWYCYTLQLDIDNDLLDDEDIFDVDSNNSSSIIPILDFLSSLEFNDENWPKYLKDCAELYESSSDKIKDFERLNPNIEKYLKNISIYFIWRYFLKAVFDEDVLSKIKLMFVSVHVIKYLFFCKWIKEGKLDLEDCIDIVKKYSEEVEYSEDNLLSFADASYDMECFRTEYLLEI